MTNEVANQISREDLEAAQLLAKEGEAAIKEAEESGDLVQETRAKLARTILEMSSLGLSVLPNEDIRTLESEKNKLIAILGAIHDGVTVQDREFNIIFQNDFVRRAFGRLGDKCYEVYEGKDCVCEDCPVKKAFEDGKSHSSERTTSMPDGSVGYWRNRAFPIRDANGEIVSCVEVGKDITEAKLHAEALRKSEERTGKILENAPFGIFEVNSVGEYLDVNEMAVEVSGYSPEELRAMSIADLLAPEYREKGLALFEELATTGKLDDEILIRTKEGELRWWSIRAVATGESFTGFCSDISEQKKAKEELQKAKEELQTIIDSVPAWIFYKDAVDRFIRVNQKLAEAFSMPRDEIEGKTAAEISPHQDAHYLEDDKRVIASGQALRNIVEPVQTPQGTRWAQTDKIPYRDEDGNIIGVIGFAQDITDRKRAEEELRESEERYRKVTENVADVILELDLEGNYTFASPSVAQLLGYTPDEMYSKNMQELLTPSSLMEMQSRIREALASGNSGGEGGRAPVAVEAEFVRKDGSTVTCEAVGKLTQNETGEITGMLGSIRDITDRKELEAQLVKSHKMEAIALLAGGIAHDFNNLLTAILGTANLAQFEIGANHPIQEDLITIQRAGERAEELTLQLLAFSKKQVLKPEVISILKCLEDLGRLARRLIPEDIKLSFTFGNNLDAIEIDPAQFERAMLNLLVNAKEAMPNGGDLRVIASNVNLADEDLNRFSNLEAGRHVEIRVEDTGIGIPPEQLGKIFDPFYTTKEEGTGLGLSSAYGTIQQSGGDMAVESTLDEGTTFTMVFPSCQTSDTIPPDHRRATELVLGNGNVLVIEDEQVVRDVTKRMLERSGFKVEMFSGAEEVLSFLNKDTEVDLVICDVKMPGMNGPELIKELRQIKPNLKVLFVSGHSEATHGIDAAENAFLQKPFNITKLSNKVRELIGGEED
jgi:PAS domain S-box-containing protein